MKTLQPKSVLEQLRLQVQLERQLAELGNQFQALPELTAAMVRVGAQTTTILREGTPPSDLETESEDTAGAQRSELFPLAKQASVLRDAILGVLPGIGEDEFEADEPGDGDAPVLISRLAQGVASLERTVYSTGLLCQMTGALLRERSEDAAEEANSSVLSFFHGAARLQQVVDFFGQVNAQNPQATLNPTDLERYIQYLKEAQQKLDELEGPELPKQSEYTPAFFAMRHNRSENTIREHLKNWSKRKNVEDRVREIGLWCITDWGVAVAFDRYLWVNRRTRASDTRAT